MSATRKVDDSQDFAQLLSRYQPHDEPHSAALITEGKPGSKQIVGQLNAAAAAQLHGPQLAVPAGSQGRQISTAQRQKR